MCIHTHSHTYIYIYSILYVSIPTLALRWKLFTVSNTMQSPCDSSFYSNHHDFVEALNVEGNICP